MRAYKTPPYPHVHYRDQAMGMRPLWPSRVPPTPSLWRRGLLVLAYVFWCTIPFAGYIAGILIVFLFGAVDVWINLALRSSSMGEAMDKAWDLSGVVFGWWPRGFGRLRAEICPEA